MILTIYKLNKWNFWIPRFILRLFTKPLVYKNVYPSSVIFDDVIKCDIKTIIKMEYRYDNNNK